RHSTDSPHWTTATVTNIYYPLIIYLGGNMVIHLSTLLKHYKRKDVRDAIVKAAEDREIAIKFGDKGFGRRPDLLKYPKDVLEFAKKGATSFHCSEELWVNPLQLNPNLKRADMDDIRKGWDLVLDIDCPELEYSKIAADLLVQALRHQGIKSLSVKFSGNHGFHIAVPFKAFPRIVHGKPTRILFPEGPRKIAAYLGEMIRPHLAKKLLAKESMKTICKNINKSFKEVVKNGRFDPFEVLQIDTVLIATRHLFRMPYSFNEKSGLISIPIKPEDILSFKKKDAEPSNVKVDMDLLDIKPKINEAKKLIIQAFDHKIEEEKIEMKKTKEFSSPEDAVPEDYFPPCIKIILQGLKDGKKRSLFVLVNFLTSCGWDYDKIEELLTSWNERNAEPLREVLIKGQLRYHKANKKKLLPPNCGNQSYYQDMHICNADNFCRKIRNPVNYAILKQKLTNLTKKKKKTKKAKKAKKISVPIKQ
ncbi:hypothetical protein KY315_00585, partial [Candidatus Woesearchaeota archaeon]|nr:hypothetical protein [Candidatus Woesearchaeota archaeon]